MNNTNLPDNPQIGVLKGGKTGLFTNYIYKAIPLAFDESMSYYETLCGLLEYLKNTVIPTLNNNADAVAELQSLYEELRTYVNNYFTNLDVQEEINNKLDAMVEDGTLPEIIASYLNSKAVFGYDTVASMKQATNLINGSYAQTLGYHTKNDGGGALYKIRTITNNDVVDESFILKLQDDSLIAELIIDDIIDVKKLGAIGDGTTDDSTIIQKAINKASNTKKVICNGNYALNSSLILNANNCDFESNGNLILINDVDALKIIDASSCNINIENITSNDNGVGIHIIASNNTISNINLNVGSILNTKKGIILESNNTKGIQYNKITWNSIYTTEHGILLKCGNNGNPWINENQFYGGRISSAIGIETQKGTEQTDKFNGNKFFNFGLEGITNIGIKLNYTQCNIFKNFRATEGFTGSHWFSFTDCEEDIINWQGTRPGLSRNLWEFSGTNKLLHFISPMRESGIMISEESIYHINGWFDVKPLYQPRNNLYNNSQTINSCRNGMFIRAGVDDNKNLVITLPDIMSNDSNIAGSPSPYLNYFFLGVLYKGGTINLIDGENNTIISDSDLTAHTLYMCVRYTTSDGNAYQLIPLGTY